MLRCATVKMDIAGHSFFCVCKEVDATSIGLLLSHFVLECLPAIVF